MTTRYQKEHYEDVAGLLRAAQEMFGEENEVIGILAHSVSILFAADNPRKCRGCGLVENINNALHQGYDWGGGFDREQFLAACGLESEG